MINSVSMLSQKSPCTNICIKDDHTFAATLLCTKTFQDIDTIYYIVYSMEYVILDQKTVTTKTPGLGGMQMIANIKG